jgi:pimeloyl-ACP methyl ester carboxylesterase
METITADGQALYFTRPTKVAGGPVILLVHGAGGTHLDWPKEIQRLPGMTVYNLDLPGHGRSVGPGRSSINEYADVVQEFMEILALQDVTIIGHSMGGAIAQALALRGLPQVTRIVVVGSSARLRVSPDVLDVALVEPEVAVDFIIRSSWGADAPDTLSNRGKKSMLQTDPAVLYGDFLACDCFDIRPKLNQIHIPTLVISGTEDKMTPLKYSRYLAENVADARLIIIEGAGHFSMLQKPRMVANAIVEFMGVENS